ncbi:MAG: hypothetical protein GC205_10065 [Bacteroidetes bacterium]|nr:hypothetical protein [Bacteroidota bacterium]
MWKTEWRLWAAFALALMGALPGAVAQESQALDQDGRIWIGGAWELWLHKDWNLKVEQQLRLDAEGRRFQSTFSEVQVEYELGKNGALFQEFRYSFRRNSQNLRSATGISWTVLDAKPWSVKVRGKAQHDFIPDDPDEGFWRSKGQIRYRINKRWSLDGSLENWTAAYPIVLASSRIRTGVGVSFDRKKNDISLGYAYDRSLSGALENPGVSHIISIQYTRMQ